MSCAISSIKRRPQNSPSHRLKRHALGLYRLALIVVALLCLWFGQPDLSGVSTEILLRESRNSLPSAASLGDPQDGFYPVLSKKEDLLGWATTTYPQAEMIQGYSGPSELFILLASDRTILSVGFLKSADTDGHVSKIRDNDPFWSQWDGKTETGAGATRDVRIVSGATLTSEAMARGVAARFGAKGLASGFRRHLIWRPSGAGIPKRTRSQARKRQA